MSKPKILFVIAAAFLLAATAAWAEPLKIRIGWIVTPGELTPVLFAHPGLARHEGKSYVIEAIHLAGPPLGITALANGDLDIGGLGFATAANAITAAGLSDLRIIGDVEQDGAEGWYSNEYMVLKTSPIRTVADLKGKILGTNAVGSVSDICQRVMLRKNNLDDRTDVTIIGIAPPNMKAALLEGKVDLVGLFQPFSMDSELRDKARTLFTQREAVGRSQVSSVVARAGFLEKNHDALVDYFEDYLRALHWYLDPANHQEAVAILANYTKQPAALFDSWSFTHRDQYRDPNAIPNVEAMQRNLDLLWQTGFLKARLDIAPYVDLRLLHEAAARLNH
jgi:ABC-type nitrate/sulfonate/bicarbonate transport system substrate-binding protein